MTKYVERARSDHSFMVLMLCAKDTQFFWVGIWEMGPYTQSND